jgi:hypothetical protein
VYRRLVREEQEPVTRQHTTTSKTAATSHTATKKVSNVASAPRPASQANEVARNPLPVPPTFAADSGSDTWPMLNSDIQALVEHLGMPAETHNAIDGAHASASNTGTTTPSSNALVSSKSQEASAAPSESVQGDDAQTGHSVVTTYHHTRSGDMQGNTSAAQNTSGSTYNTRAAANDIQRTQEVSEKIVNVADFQAGPSEAAKRRRQKAERQLLIESVAGPETTSDGLQASTNAANTGSRVPPSMQQPSPADPPAAGTAKKPVTSADSAREWYAIHH